MLFFPPERYQPRVRQVFRALRRVLHVALPKARIEHIGSSAVQGLWSKGDLDVYIEVEPEAFDAARVTLQQRGFYLKRDTLQTAQLCYFVAEGLGVDVGLQLVARGSRFRFFLIFRDRLRRDAKLRATYNQLKHAAQHLNAQDYRRLKSEFIVAILMRGRRLQSARQAKSSWYRRKISSN